MTGAALVPDGPADRQPLSDPGVDAVDWLRRFEVDHGESVATVQPMGRAGARIVVVGPDGAFGDAVVASQDEGTQVCRRAGIDLVRWDRDLSARVLISPRDRLRMAGRRS